MTLKVRSALLKLFLAMTLICLVAIVFAKQGSSVVTATKFDTKTGMTLTIDDPQGIQQVLVYGKDNTLVQQQNFATSPWITHRVISLPNDISTKFPLIVVVRDNQTSPAYDYWQVEADGKTYGPCKTMKDAIAASPVGGIAVSIDKLGLLAPYIGLASTTMIGAVATVVYVKRVKRRKEKQ